VGEAYAGLTHTDGETLADEWARALADMAACGPDGVWAWAALYGESTGNWWPPRSSLLARGLVNAVVRSPTVERLHISEPDTFLDNQIGTFSLNWASVSLLDELVGSSPEPTGWGLGGNDAPTQSWFAAAQNQFPAGWAAIRALGTCLSQQRSRMPVTVERTASAESAVDWLIAHAEDAAAPRGISAMDDAEWDRGSHTERLRECRGGRLPAAARACTHRRSRNHRNTALTHRQLL